jgi:RNA polymerase-binding transcription factor DksA
MTMNRQLDRATREELAARLCEERSRLFRTVATTHEELTTLEGREPGAPIEDAARVEIAGILARLEEREQDEMREIDAAMGRLGAGTYGTCESCRGSIPLARLRAIPATRRCLSCETAREHRTPGEARPGTES